MTPAPCSRLRQALRALAVVAAAWGASAGSCDRAVRQHPLTLEPQVFSFHRAIRDKRFAEATQYMVPEVREAFVRSWARADRGAEFPELEVLVQRTSDDAEFTHIEAELHYILANDLVERRYRMLEIWRGVDRTWVLSNLVEAPPELREPAPAAPVDPAAAPPAPAPATGEGFGGR
ncbi:MAG: hypothetical protein HY904_24530 [Deltaproteobacteria bacterium]|nr:hypothetical protein [Deltaproteobacteria bacterium]